MKQTVPIEDTMGGTRKRKSKYKEKRNIIQNAGKSSDWTQMK